MTQKERDTQFQFHTGSIKSCKGFYNIYDSIQVSIPYWFD